MSSQGAKQADGGVLPDQREEAIDDEAGRRVRAPRRKKVKRVRAERK